MKAMLGYAMIAAVAVSGLSLGLRADSKSVPTSGQKLEQIGGTLLNATASREIRGLLANVVNDGATEGRFNDLVDSLAKVDRTRIGDQHEKMTDLNRAIAHFRSDFKAKYHEDFTIRPEHFKEAVIYAGRDSNSATVNLPDIVFNRKANGLKADPTIGDPAAKPIPNMVKLGAGLTLNLIHEGKMKGQWRIDITAEIGAVQLKGNLTKRLQVLDDQKAAWPKDVDSAYHSAAFQVLSALNDAALVSDK